MDNPNNIEETVVLSANRKRSIKEAVSAAKGNTVQGNQGLDVDPEPKQSLLEKILSFFKSK